MVVPRRKRRRPALSCIQCRKRKIKCDRNVPCDQCKQSNLATSGCTHMYADDDSVANGRISMSQTGSAIDPDPLLTPASSWAGGIENMASGIDSHASLGWTDRLKASSTRAGTSPARRARELATYPGRSPPQSIVQDLEGRIQSLEKHLSESGQRQASGAGGVVPPSHKPRYR